MIKKQRKYISRLTIESLEEEIGVLRVRNIHYQEVVTIIRDEIDRSKRSKKKLVRKILEQNYAFRRIICILKDTMHKSDMWITKLKRKIRKELKGKLRGIPIKNG